ncbi:putative outer membrane starch-binding protein [Arcticibacter tournemirensis]|nr:putative outer membrane starch-binding protein [Arcticibacter tournemirensis]
MMKRIISIIAILISVCTSSCNKYMDIVPDNVPELDNAFATRIIAERYLFTCYSYLPGGFDLQSNPALLGGDEFWLNSTANFGEGSYGNWYIARGNQNVNSPLNNYWEGSNQAKNLWRGIRDCNIFLANVYKVPDMDDLEKDRWRAEALFLKAYYHYYLLRMYGPVHIMDDEVPVFSDPEKTQYERRPVDECMDYIVGLVDSAIVNLPDDITATAQENGRLSKLVAYAMKAEMLVTAASPLFNGNTDYPGFVNSENKPFINPVFSSEKWVKAADACKLAVEFAETYGRTLYKWKPTLNLTTPPQQSTINQMSYREALAQRDNNSEQIWINNVSRATQGFQAAATVRSYDPAYVDNKTLTGYLSPTINVALLYYSKNGVPIDEDLTYDYGARFNLRAVPTGTSPYMYNMIPGHTTVGMHFDREDRFYASLSFDGGRYFMSSHTSDANAFNTVYRSGGNAAPVSIAYYSITGYTPKKLVSYRNVVGSSDAYTVYEYPYPIMRLAELYLLYAEAQNEASGPSEEVYNAIDKVRARSGLSGVVDSWAGYSRNPGKPATKEGLREIIRRERTIELMFEGKRFWDLRRWKTATLELNANILGWGIREKETQLFYRSVSLYNRTFAQKDYLWPLSLSELRRNSKLTQNPGW